MTPAHVLVVEDDVDFRWLLTALLNTDPGLRGRRSGRWGDRGDARATGRPEHRVDEQTRHRDHAPAIRGLTEGDN
jgi:hypothetical protein